MKFYVYVYSDPANDTPFYVGMGKGNRKFAHLREAKNNPEPVQGQHKLNTIRKMIREGREPVIRTVYETEVRDNALEFECSLIATIGRQDIGTGTLTNMTSGGEGVSGISGEQREILSERMKGRAPAKNTVTGSNELASVDDPRWLTGELVGVLTGKTSDPEGSRRGLTAAKNTVTGSNELASVDDPRWLTGELVGVRRGMKCNDATRIAASKRHRGVAKTTEHNEKVSATMKELAWYLEESTGKARRLKPAEAGHGFIRISGPHKKTPI